MRSKLMYVELKTGYSDDGPAWIGKAFFSKSGRTVYFNGKALLSGKYDVVTGDEYWTSGVKKSGTNRHTWGKGLIHIDKDVVDEYLVLTGQIDLAKSKYKVVELDRTIPKDLVNEILNTKIDS